MATVIWQGGAPAIAQVDRSDIAGNDGAHSTGYDFGDTITVTINGKAVTYALVVADESFGLILISLAAALNASVIPEFAEITWANYTNTALQGTADTAGKPVTWTISATTSGNGAMGAVGSVTANSGPNCADTLANYSTGALPVDETDTVIFENSDVDCLYGLDLSAVDATSLTIKQSYTGNIGLPRTNIDAGTNNSYVEYRDTYLKMGATTVEIGEGEGTGSGRVKLDFGSDDVDVTVRGKGNRAEAGIPCVLLKGSSASNQLAVLRGDVGVAFFGGETTNLSGGLKLGHVGRVLSDAYVVLGSGVTLAAITQSGGQLQVESNLTTFTQYAGEANVGGSATITTATIHGRLQDSSSGIFTTLILVGEYDHSQSLTAKTITNAVELYKDAVYRDPYDVVTEDGDFDLNQCRRDQVTIEKPANKNIAFSAVS